MRMTSLFVKQSLLNGVFIVDKIKITVCGGQTISNLDPTNEVFNIVRDATGTTNWISFPLTTVFATSGGGLP